MPTNGGTFGSKNDDCAVPVDVTSSPRMSGATSASQPDPACGNTLDSGNTPCGMDVKLVSVNTIAFVGSPVPTAENVASTHGSVVAVRQLVEPEPAQAAPRCTVEAGHVDARQARYGDAMVPMDVKLPPNITLPAGAMRIAMTAPLPLPMDDHVDPFHRARFCAGTPPAALKEPPTNKSPSGSAMRLNTLPGDPVMPEPSGLQLTPFQSAMLAADA